MLTYDKNGNVLDIAGNVARTLVLECAMRGNPNCDCDSTLRTTCEEVQVVTYRMVCQNGCIWID